MKWLIWLWLGLVAFGVNGSMRGTPPAGDGGAQVMDGGLPPPPKP